MYEVSILCAKTAVVLAYLFIAFRLLGKRQVSQMNLYDLALIMALANSVQNAMTMGSGKLRVGIACASTLLVIGWALSRLFVRYSHVEKLIIGQPTVIVNNGKVLKDRMGREHITDDELRATLRQHGLSSSDQVKLAVLEVDGSISIVPKSAEPG